MNTSNDAIRRIWPMMTDDQLDRAGGNTLALARVIADETGDTIEAVRHRLELLESSVGRRASHHTPGGTASFE